MLAIKYRQNSRKRNAYVKIILVTLVSVLILFSEPILAQKSKRKSKQSHAGSQKQQQVRKSTPAPRRQSSSNAGSVRTRNRVSSAPRSTQPQIRSSAPNLSRRSNLQRTSQPSIRQPGNTTANRQPNRATTGSVTTPRPGTRSSTQNRPSNSVGTVGSTGAGSDQGRQATKSVSTRISSRRTSQIGSVVGNSKEPASTTRSQSMANVGLPTTRIRSSIGSVLGSKKTNTSIDAEQSRAGTNKRTGTTRWSRIGSRIIGRKSPAATESQNLDRRSAGIAKSETVADSILSKKQPAIAPTRTPRGILGRLGLSKRQKNEDAEVPRESGTAGRGAGRNRGRRGLVTGEPEGTSTRRGVSEVRPARTGRSGRNSDGAGRVRQQRSGRAGPSRPRYHDRPNLVRHENSNVYVYRDRSAELCYRIVRPTTRYIVSYSRGWDFSFGYIYPFYHRKYVFVSLGGYWPLDYSCARYYWYGWHPYYWCGYYPVAHEVQGDTYNYYTYNYYNDDSAPVTSGQSTDYIQPVDHNTFADVREKLARQQAEGPEEPTLADSYFENAVKAFEAGNFDIAIERFADAMVLAPDDMILPYAYCQALLANQQYSEAAEVLRVALKKVNPEEEGVFYPRGLYADDEVLFEQIDHLNEKAELLGFDADLQLLLGYQLLGIGELDEAVEPLLFASQDAVNADAAVTLIELLEKIRNSEAEGQEVGAGDIPPAEGAIGKGDTIRLRESTFMATMFTLVTSGGIFYYAKC